MTVASAYAMQKIELKLSDDPSLARRVIRLLPARLARDVTDDVLAHRELARLTPARPLSAFRPGPAAAAAKLRAFYAEAERRSVVPWQLLAAVNFVESDFGRLRETSVAGAQGPMQFMPSTWRSYGRGDIHDPHAAILAAGRFLRAAGAPPPAAFRGRSSAPGVGGSAADAAGARERGALYRYNPSAAYVDAVERYAARIRRSTRAFRQYYARPLVVRTPAGYRRLR
ncbi:MAG TPA: lytic transglycosylase domain-containing protein [Gaiellaceae bacterium]